MWLSPTFFDAEAIERAQQRFNAWNRFISGFPNEVYIYLFETCIRCADIEIQTLSDVCKRWNGIIARNPRHFIRCYLETRFGRNENFMQLIRMQKDLKGFKKMWGFKVTKKGSLRRKTNKKFVEILDADMVVSGDIFVTDTEYILVGDHVENLKLEDGSLYSGKAQMKTIPFDTDEYEVIIRKKRKKKTE